MATNGIHGPIDIAISGMRAQNENISLISSNVANYRTTDAGNGEPYRRLEAKLKTEKNGQVTFAGSVPDNSDFRYILDPGHAHAGPDGYVRMPNVDLPTEMINLTMATRAYQSNAAILKRYQQIVENSLELLR